MDDKGSYFRLIDDVLYNNGAILMKALIVISILLLITFPVSAKECSECPKDEPCGYTFPAGDGCNTCEGSTWCKDGKWFTDGLAMCTLLACVRTYKIPNPFNNEMNKGRN